MPSYLTAMPRTAPTMQPGGGTFNESPAPDASVPMGEPAGQGWDPNWNRPYGQLNNFGPGGAQPVASLTTPSPNTGVVDNAGPVNGDYQGWFNNLIAGKPYNQQTLLELEPTLNKYGIQLTPPNAQGDRTKIRLPNGDWVRVGFGEGKPVWIVNGGQGSGAGQPGMTGGQGPGGMGYGSLMTPFTDQFHAPTADEAAQTPGYQFAMQQGLKGVQQSAAAKGTLLTGGTMKGLEQYGQGLASQTYGDAYNRSFNEYLTKYNIFTGNQDRPFDKLYKTTSLGANAAAQ